MGINKNTTWPQSLHWAHQDSSQLSAKGKPSTTKPLAVSSSTSKIVRTRMDTRTQGLLSKSMATKACRRRKTWALFSKITIQKDAAPAQRLGESVTWSLIQKVQANSRRDLSSMVSATSQIAARLDAFLAGRLRRQPVPPSPSRHHHEHLDAYLLQPKSSTCCWLRSSRSVRNQRRHGGSQRSDRNRHPPEFFDPYLHLLCRTWCVPTQCQD